MLIGRIINYDFRLSKTTIKKKLKIIKIIQFNHRCIDAKKQEGLINLKELRSLPYLSFFSILSSILTHSISSSIFIRLGNSRLESFLKDILKFIREGNLSLLPSKLNVLILFSYKKLNCLVERSYLPVSAKSFLVVVSCEIYGFFIGVWVDFKSWTFTCSSLFFPFIFRLIVINKSLLRIKDTLCLEGRVDD